jgi:hypothetical protein
VGWSWLDALRGAGPLDDDAATAAREDPGTQDRPDLDFVF